MSGIQIDVAEIRFDRLGQWLLLVEKQHEGSVSEHDVQDALDQMCLESPVEFLLGSMLMKHPQLLADLSRSESPFNSSSINLMGSKLIGLI